MNKMKIVVLGSLVKRIANHKDIAHQVLDNYCIKQHQKGTR